MKNFLYLILFISTIIIGKSQSVPVPGEAQSQPIALTNATIHIGNGSVLENASILFENGKIANIGSSITMPNQVKQYDCSGKHIYPGLIAMDTRIGINEVEALRQTRDFREVGRLNPNVRTIIAYNTDSWVTPTVRTNGILIAQVAPEGGSISGTSSVVQLDAWNWEDASYLTDDALYLNWPTSFRFNGWWAEPGDVQKVDNYTKQLTELKTYFDQAKSYFDQKSGAPNLRFEGMKGLFDGSKQLFIRADEAREIISGVRFAQDYGITPVIVGGRESVAVADFLVENDVPVVLGALHRTPDFQDEGLFNPFEIPKQLSDAGVRFALTYADYWQVRNLPFQAGQAVAFGLDHEDALSSITLEAAKILGIDEKTGSLEVGKDANIVVSEGDLLDMMTNKVTMAYIQGRSVDLGNKQKDLYIKFSDKLGHDYDKP